jgi:hypothetical protein
MEKMLKQQFDGLEINPSDSLWQRIDAELPEGELEYRLRMHLNEQEIIPSGRAWDAIARELPDSHEQIPTFKYWGLASVLGVVMVAALGYLFSINQITEGGQTAKNEKITPADVASNSSKPENVITTIENRSVNEQLKKVQPDSEIQPMGAMVMQNQTTASENYSNRVSNSATHSIRPLKNKDAAVQDKITSHKSVNGIDIRVGEGYKKNEPNNHAASTLLNADKQTVSESSEMIIQEPSTVSDDKNIEQKSLAESNIIDLNAEQKSTVVASGNSIHDTLMQAPIPATLLTGEEDLTPYSITATAGINYSMMRLVLPSGAARYPLVENKALRQSLEQPSFDFAFSFMLDYAINNRLRISSGIGRVIFNQQFYYNITQPVLVPNNTELVNNMSFTTDSIITGNSYQSIIRYTWTEIPLLFTYSFNSHHKWYFALQSGLSYAILSTVESAMVNYDNVGILVLNNQNAFPGFQNNVFALLNPTVAYKLKPDVELMFQPAIRYALNSMVANEKWLQQYPMLAGFNLAMRKRF